MSKLSNFNLFRIFANKNLSFKETIQKKVNDNLQKRFKIQKCFIFNIPSVPQLILITFNVIKSAKVEHRLKDLQHYKIFRKKQTNTLYQINTIPKIIKLQNKGLYQKDFIIDWNNFQNTIILSDKNNINKLVIYKIEFNGYSFMNDNLEVR